MILPLAAAVLFQTPAHFTKRALLVGAWDYRSKSWPNLSSRNDVELIAKTLETKFGFVPSSGGKIMILSTREQTTRQSILDSFRSFLASDVRAGDTIYFHYSGHGYQVPDTDPALDPTLKLSAPINPIIGNAPDGLDETLLPTDDPDKNAGQIRNDELGLLVKQVFDSAQGKPINVVVTLDCCHSGGGTRGIARTVRGRPYVGPRPKTTKLYDPSDPRAVFLSAVRGYTFMSACRQDQEAGEAIGPNQKSYGRFTLALTEALSKCTPSTTYRDLFDGLDSIVASRWTFGAVDAFSQNPQLEGEANRNVFGAAAAPQPDSFSLLRVGKSQYRLKAGALQGLNDGSVLSLSRDGKRIATLTVKQVSLVDAAIDSTPPLKSISDEVLSVARAKVISTGQQSPPLRIDVSAVNSRPEFKEIQGTIQDRIPAVQFVSDSTLQSDYKLTYGKATAGPNSAEGYLIFRSANGAEVTADADGKSNPIAVSEAPAVLADKMFSEIRYEAISKLQNDYSGQTQYVEIRAVPCETREVGEGLLEWVRDLPESGSTDRAVGQRFAIQYKVVGNWEPYVAVLDLTPDGHVSQLWPIPTQFGESIQIKRPTSGKPPTSWQYLKVPNSDQIAVFRITPPLGREMLKAVASERPLPFRDMLESTRGAISGLSPVGRTFQQFSSVTKRSQAETTDPGEVWSTRQIVFTVKGSQ